jgi:DNA-binding LacI/PurR family transcriptional regulator
MNVNEKNKPVQNLPGINEKPARPPAKVTLSDVASAARVSKATASNVFSRPERVRDSLRQRVEQAARELGYAGPDPKGRLLSSGKVNAIGVVPPAAFGISLFFKDPYTQLFLAGVSEVCEEYGVGLSLVSGRDDQAAWGIQTALVDGFILNSIEQASFIAPARRAHMPIVVMGPDGGPDASSVDITGEVGTRQLTEHLLALGHRRFIIGVPLDEFRPPVFHPPGSDRTLVAPILPAPERLAGIDSALRAAGLSLDAMPIVEACGTPEEEAAFGNGAELLLDNLGDATAVMSINDKFALAVLRCATARGLSVPRDLSVTGFDGVAESVTSVPPLTTAVQPVKEVGATAARLLLDGGPPRHVTLPVELAIRGSTAKPRRP